ncbi:MAG TPA: sulfur transferase domain-containing protein [Bauldia sp.]|nr:sulfur transferase domain-containing protein [Bauldia sp.]
MPDLVPRLKRSWNRITRGTREGIRRHTPRWARRILGRPATYLDMILVDHGVFRLVYMNRHRLAADAWRSAQPAPHQFRKLAAEGIRTIVNLRGAHDSGSYFLEERACARYGLKLVNFKLRSRAAPLPAEIKRAKRLFSRLQYPVLMHCKSGADRAGLMSVLFCIFREGMPVEEARRHLSLRYGHIRQADTGILDYFFERYLADNAVAPIDFLAWVETRYDPEELKASFRARGWANRLVNGILRRE